MPRIKRYVRNNIASSIGRGIGRGIGVFIGIFIVFALLISVAPVFAFADDGIIISVDGQPLQTDVEPIIKDSWVFAPIRAIGEALGFIVLWDEAESTVYIKDDFYVGSVIIGGNSVKRSRYADRASASDAVPLYMMEYETDAPPMLQNDRTLVPLRAVSECLNADVEWIPDANTIAITYDHALDMQKYDKSGYVKPDLLRLTFFYSDGAISDVYDFEHENFMIYKTEGDGEADGDDDNANNDADADASIVLKPLAFYMVNSGDTVKKIATRYYGDTNEPLYDLILQANKISATNIKIGEILIIPAIPDSFAAARP